MPLRIDAISLHPEHLWHSPFPMLNLLADLFNEILDLKSSNATYWSKERRLLSRKAGGFCLGGKRSLSVTDSYRNALIVGGTGTGKSSTTILPSIFRMAQHGHSLVVHDPSMELGAMSLSYLQKQGYKTAVLRYDQSAWSDGYNPLARVHNSNAVEQFADTLIRTGLVGGSKDPFWEGQAKQVLAFLIHLLHTQAKSLQSMGNVITLLRYLQRKPESVLDLAKRISPKLHDEAMGILSLSERVLSGTIATCFSALTLYQNTEISQVTSFDSLPIEELRQKPCAIFIQNPILMQELCAPLTSLFFRQVFESLFESLPRESERSVFFLIDEAATFKSDWALYLSQVRKYKVGVLLALQAMDQLAHLYSPHESRTIEANCLAKLYYTNQNQHQAESLSRMIGPGEQGLLMDARAVRQMPPSQALLFVGNQSPAKVSLKPHFKSSLRKRVLPLPPQKRKMPFASPPQIKL